MSSNYYHAGTQDADGNISWSGHTRRTPAAAEREAKRMTPPGMRPIVEYWDRSHGLRPGDADCVIAAYFPRDES